MLKSHHLGAEREMLKWIVLLTIASALALVFVRQLAGAPTEVEPRTLPQELVESALPLLGADSSAAEVTPLVGGPSPHDERLLNQSLHVWLAIAAHGNGDVDEALRAWQQLELTCDMDAWRHLAIGAGLLQQGKLEAAAEALGLAEQSDPQNPLVSYYRAIYFLQKSVEAPARLTDTILASTSRHFLTMPPLDRQFSKSAYESLAMAQFERVLELADNVSRQDLLVPAPSTVFPVLSPTVNDLLTSLSAENFAGKSHHALGDLWLMREGFEQAERHFDQAAESGVRIISGYRQLGRRYEALHRHVDAVRVYLKDLKQANGVSRSAVKTIDNLRRALIELW